MKLDHGTDVVTAWAVASMLASYSNSDGSGITVSADTIRKQLRIGKPKLDRTLRWLTDSGWLTTTVNHGRGTPTQRALALPTTRDERTALAGPINPPDDRTTQGGPINPVLNGPIDAMNGPVAPLERTGNHRRHPFDRTAQARPQPEHLNQPKPGRGGPHAHARATPAAPTVGITEPGPEPPRRCADHAAADPGHPCVQCKNARLDNERWLRHYRRWTRLHPEALCPPSTTDQRVAAIQALKKGPPTKPNCDALLASPEITKPHFDYEITDYTITDY
jgi:hypothetical protein